jgi:phage terminase small subunit
MQMSGKRKKLPQNLIYHPPSRQPAPVPNPQSRPEDWQPPPAPAGLSPAVQALWADYWASPVALAVDLRSDRLLLEQLFWTANGLTAVAAALRNEPLIIGRYGTPVRNPLWVVYRQLMADLTKLAEVFGCAPLFRTRLGISVSEAGLALEKWRNAVDETERPVPKISIIETDETGRTAGRIVGYVDPTTGQEVYYPAPLPEGTTPYVIEPDGPVVTDEDVDEDIGGDDRQIDQNPRRGDAQD